MGGLTPMMQQYMALKEKHADCILFFRLGDFYEMFFEDAKTASRELDLVLTGRDCGLDERAPMCGVPFHSAQGYINQLIEKGYKVAICEQLTDPAESKGLVERGVTRIVTPGTVVDASMLSDGENNFLVSLVLEGGRAGIACADVSTGLFEVGETDAGESGEALLDELARYDPAEVIVDPNTMLRFQELNALLGTHYLLSPMDAHVYAPDRAADILCDHFGVASLDGFGCAHMPLGVGAAAGLIAYLGQTQKNALPHINRIRVINRNRTLLIDETARRNMELTRSLRDGTKKGTLLELLDKTLTAMGARLLRRWIEEPLQDVREIGARLDAVEELMRGVALAQGLKEALGGIYDIERLITRVAYASVNARDLLALTQSLKALPAVADALKDASSDLLQTLLKDLDTLEDVAGLIERAVNPGAPAGVRDGGIIRAGYDAQIDALRDAAAGGKKWISELEAEEREATGIKNLRVGFNKVFGYYIEVTKSYYDKVPYRYVRKQTLANSERYITQELKEMEETVLGAEDKLVRLEYRVFSDLREHVEGQTRRVQRAAQVVALLDTLLSLAACALEYGYVRPELDESLEIRIEQGRHPVVERVLKRGMFVPNDVVLDTKDNRMLIITGPNMSGKSTYMRQTALIVIMAHIGSFVPAKSARIGRVDRVFTRIGATDDLASGQSTFMVEMAEVAAILNNATVRSLIVLDEIGRGTSTFDGLSIAWAVLEYICDPEKLGARTLFSTHYHELTELENTLAGVKNYRVAVKEVGEEVVFLRRITRGGSDKSFGIHVAAISGIPQEVTQRAREILSHLEQVDMRQSSLMDAPKQPDGEGFEQVSLLGTPAEVAREIRELDLEVTTPIEALNILHGYQQRLNET
ncbi:MAG: DNA mismatch repair protein MutS [Christensenellales bacterium]